MKTILKNIIPAIRDQLPLARLVKNVRSGAMFGLFFKRSHYRENGTEKVRYNTKKSAVKAAESMEKKQGFKFRSYKCIFCNGYHIGANRYLMQKKEQ